MASSDFRVLKADSLTGIAAKRNYIKNPGADTNSYFWNTFADAAASRPTDMTGGSPASTWSTTSSNPLSLTRSFQFAKAGSANRQGEGVSIDFKIDRADRGKVFKISFDYEIVSGTYSGGTDTTDSDLIAYVYRVDATGRLIEPTPFKLRGSVVGQNYSYEGTFQADGDADDYRFGLYIATTTTQNFQINFDNFEISRQAASASSVVSDWQEYTPTITGFGTVSAVDVFSRRVGDTLEVMGSFTAGTVAASSASISLGFGGVDGGVFADTSKISASKALLGHAGVDANSGSDFGWEIVYGTTSVVYVGKQSSTAAGINVPINGSDVSGNGNVISFFFSVPILGWGSSADVLSGGDGRAVAARYSSNNNQTATRNAFTVIKYEDMDYDSHSAYDTSTGTYTVPVAGYYRAYGSAVAQSVSGGSQGRFRFKHNGTVVMASGVSPAGTDAIGTQTSASGMAEFHCAAGDTIQAEFFFDDNTADRGLTGNSYDNVFTVHRLAGPEQIQAGEKVVMSAHGSTTSISTAVETVVFDNKDTDTHGSINLSSGAITIPAAGDYQFNVGLRFTSQTIGAGGLQELFIFKNGTQEKSICRTHWSSITAILELNGAALLKGLVAGDVITIRAYNNTTTTLIGTSSKDVFVDMFKVK